MLMGTPDSVSEPPDRPRVDTIADAERHERPTLVRPLTFDDLATPGPRFRNTRHLVPIESVSAGDEQVFAARGDRFGDPVIDLDMLTDFRQCARLSPRRGFGPVVRFRT
jgi:hypothetical protein